MIKALFKEPSKDAQSISFLNEQEFEKFTRKKIGKNTGVILPSETLQVIIDRDSYKNKLPNNIFIKCLDDSVLRTCGNIIITSVDAKKGGVICSKEGFEEEYKELLKHQDEFFQEWFMNDGI